MEAGEAPHTVRLHSPVFDKQDRATVKMASAQAEVLVCEALNLS